MKLYELLKYLKEEDAVSALDIQKMAASPEIGWIGMVSFMGAHSHSEDIFPIFQLGSERKWCLSEKGHELLQLFEEAERFVK